MQAIGYCRVSTDEQGESGLGLSDQKSTIQAEVVRRGWDFQAMYADVASGKSLKGRDDFGRALQVLADGEADVLVVDVGSEVTPWTRRFWLRARLVIVVTTTDYAAVMGTYAAIKLSSADANSTDIRVLANQCNSDRAATEVERRLATACQRFLGRTVAALPSLPRHAADSISGIGPEPRVWDVPNSQFGHGVLWLARAVSELMSVNEPTPTLT